MISLGPDGDSIVVYDGNRTLFRFSSDGTRLARLVLPAQIQQTFSVNRNGKILIVYLVSGELERIDIN
jgi:hypothetical protein